MKAWPMLKARTSPAEDEARCADPGPPGGLGGTRGGDGAGRAATLEDPGKGGDGENLQRFLGRDSDGWEDLQKL